jgi:DNA-directed RNA polymerase subunit RPC12/RpoP
VRYVEDKPGLFTTHEVTIPGKDDDTAAAAAGPTGEVTGAFQTAKDYACPFCGSHAVLVCGRCGADLCAGPGATGRCTCPNCQAQIEVSGRATSATGLLGLGKGKGK